VSHRRTNIECWFRQALGFSPFAAKDRPHHGSAGFEIGMVAPLVTFKAAAVADQCGLEGRATTHFESGGDDTRERVFDEFGVAHLVGSCEDLV
jgi:hypothetical protein